MRFKLNQKVIAINNAPYHHFTGHNEEETSFIEIEIIKIIKNVPGEFNPKETGTGYLGKGSDGFDYGFNYPTINQSYGDTKWTRYCSDNDFDKLSKNKKDAMVKDYIWHDITSFQCPAIAKFCKNKNYIDYCKKHQHHFYKKQGCFRCKHNLTEPETIMNMTEHNWTGWY